MAVGDGWVIKAIEEAAINRARDQLIRNPDIAGITMLGLTPRQISYLFQYWHERNPGLERYQVPVE